MLLGRIGNTLVLVRELWTTGDDGYKERGMGEEIQ